MTRANLFSPRVKETLPGEVLKMMHAPGQTDAIPFATPDLLEGYDAFLFGIPTRYGNFPAQWKAFWDSTGKQWQTGAYVRNSQDTAKTHTHTC